MREQASEEEHSSSTQRICFEAIDTAFQIFTLRGPLCAEPVEGVAVSIDSIQIDDRFDGVLFFL